MKETITAGWMSCVLFIGSHPMWRWLMDGHKMESSGSSDIGNSISGGSLMIDSATTYVANTRVIETATDAKTVVIARVVMMFSSLIESLL